MTRGIAIELRHELADPRRVCAALALEPSKTERHKWRCPRHGGTSLSIRLGPDRTLQARCFGCDFAGDVLTLIAEVEGLSLSSDFRAVLVRAAELAGRSDLLAELELGGEHVAPRLRRPILELAPAPERDYPPSDEVHDLLDACGYVSDDDEVRALLERRGLDPERVDDLRLARVIPRDASLPRWARFDGQPWTATGHRLVLPVVDAFGAVRSVRSWRVTDGDTPKRLPPAGRKAGGLVLADPFARTLLAAGRHVAGMPAPLRLVVVEGEPDFLTWATRFSDANADAPLVLGIPGSGSWSDELAARIPDGTRVIIRTDRDQAGNDYATQVATSLRDRCHLLRPKAAA